MLLANSVNLCDLCASVVKPSLRSMEGILYHRGTKVTEEHREIQNVNTVLIAQYFIHINHSKISEI